MSLIKDPFLPVFPFSMEHQYSTAEKVISIFRAIKKKKLPQRMKIASPRQRLL